MDDLRFGTRDKRGDWSPNEPAAHAPLFAFPPRPLAVLKWLPHYFLPWNALFMLSALAWWYWILPETEVMKTFAWGWILRLYVINSVAVLIFYSLFELRLYYFRAQQNRFKYNAKWPGEQKNPAFFFQNQYLDSLIWTYLSAMPIWTGIQAVILNLYANGYVPWLTLAENPVYLVVLVLVAPVIHEFHFYCIHRLIHTPLLYRYVHSVHHNSVNPSPFSSLAMHPVEHLLYLGVAFWHVILPSHPLIAMYQLHFAGFGAIPGHIGFEKMEVGAESAVDSHAFIHNLHHKFFEVNYGDGLIPLDRWFGTFHDGTREADAQMQARLKKRRDKLAAGKGAA